MPMPAFAPVDSPEDVFEITEMALVAAAALVVSDVEGATDEVDGVVDEVEEVLVVEVATKSAAFHRMDTPYAFNPPAAVLSTPYLVVFVPFTEVNDKVELGRSDPLTVHASVAYWGQLLDF
jgi:hypothetical protein